MPKKISRSRGDGERIYNRARRSRYHEDGLKELFPSDQQHGRLGASHSQAGHNSNYRDEHSDQRKFLGCSSRGISSYYIHSKRGAHSKKRSSFSNDENNSKYRKHGVYPNLYDDISESDSSESYINHFSPTAQKNPWKPNVKPLTGNIHGNHPFTCNATNSTNWVNPCGNSHTSSQACCSFSSRINPIHGLLIENSKHPDNSAYRDLDFDDLDISKIAKARGKRKRNRSKKESNCLSVEQKRQHISTGFQRESSDSSVKRKKKAKPIPDTWPRGRQLEEILDQAALYRLFASTSPPPDNFDKFFSSASDEEDGVQSGPGSVLESFVSDSSNEDLNHEKRELEGSGTLFDSALNSPTLELRKSLDKSDLYLREPIGYHSNQLAGLSHNLDLSRGSPLTNEFTTSRSCTSDERPSSSFSHNYSLSEGQLDIGTNSLEAQFSRFDEGVRAGEELELSYRYASENPTSFNANKHLDESDEFWTNVRDWIGRDEYEEQNNSPDHDYELSSVIAKKNHRKTESLSFSPESHIGRLNCNQGCNYCEHTDKISSSSSLLAYQVNRETDLEPYFIHAIRGSREGNIEDKLSKQERYTNVNNIRSHTSKSDYSRGYVIGGSMKALRDIAKSSIPSFSSLQYLPSVLNTRFSQQSEVKPHPKSVNSKCNRNKKMDYQGKARTTNTDNSTDPKCESELPLFQRLCLCNCGCKINRKHHEPTKVDTNVQDKRLSSRLTRPGSSLDASLEDDENKTEAELDESIIYEVKEQERARRSHSFLNILKLPSSLASSKPTTQTEANPKGELEVLKPGDITNKREVSLEKDKTCEEGNYSNSFSLSSCLRQLRGKKFASNEDMSEQHLGSSRASLGQRHAGVRSSTSEKQQGRPQSACSNREICPGDGSGGNSKQFAKDPTHYASRLSDADIKVEEVSEIDSTDGIAKKKKRSSQSFLSRSLSRLSFRKLSPSKEVSKHANHPTSKVCNKEIDTSSCDELSEIQSALSSVSLQKSWHDSYNSLGDNISSRTDTITLSPSPDPCEPVVKLFLASELILNQVDFTRNENLTSNCRKRDPFTPNSQHQSGYSNSLSPGSQLSRSRSGSVNKSPRLTQSPVEFTASMNSVCPRIEDAIQVVSTEHFEKHIEVIRESQLEAQKRLFTTWINYYCPNLIRRDLIHELRDGIKLIGLLAVLARDTKLLSQYERLNSDKQSLIYRVVTSNASIHRHLSNVSIAIDYLRDKRGMKLVNLNLMDIVSGKPNVILGLCWGIILNFQLDISSLRALGSDDNSSISSDLSTSKLSLSSTLSDESSNLSRKLKSKRNQPNLAEEYTARDLVAARKNLLKLMNKKFNLKLTNLTSSLLDSDVLLSVIRQQLPTEEERLALDLQLKQDSWSTMDGDAKLEYCFELAHSKLQVPRLFSVADLRHRNLADDRSKPILVYLSMLICRNERTGISSEGFEDLDLDSGPTGLESKLIEENESIWNEISSRLTKVDTKNKFSLNNISSTLEQIEQLENLTEKVKGLTDRDESLISRFDSLKAESIQVERLIAWINDADRLFETPHKSVSDLVRSLDNYKHFFASQNLPKLPTNICPTLERQYSECLSTARQRKLTMEQTLQNWRNFEKSQDDLKNWLDRAETELESALGPIDSSELEIDHASALSQHTDRLDRVVRYFELEEIDADASPNSSSVNASRVLSNSSSVDDVASNDRLGSALSLSSIGSRVSMVQGSKMATYFKLIDDFELKCKLLAATLDANQKMALLAAARQLKLRLKVITEQRVPQVVNELRSSICQCELWINDHMDHENSSQLNSPLATDTKGSDGTETPSESDQQLENAELMDCQMDSGFPADQSLTPAGSHSSSAERDTDGQEVKARKKRDHSRTKAKRRSASSKGKIHDKRAPNKKRVTASEEDDSSVSSVVQRIKQLSKTVISACRKTMPVNIILLLFVAGMFVVPMLQKDACCELSSGYISPSQLTFREKPT